MYRYLVVQWRFVIPPRLRASGAHRLTAYERAKVSQDRRTVNLNLNALFGEAGFVQAGSPPLPCFRTDAAENRIFGMNRGT